MFRSRLSMKSNYHSLENNQEKEHRRHGQGMSERYLINFWRISNITFPTWGDAVLASVACCFAGGWNLALPLTAARRTEDRARR